MPYVYSHEVGADTFVGAKTLDVLDLSRSKFKWLKKKLVSVFTTRFAPHLDKSLCIIVDKLLENWNILCV